MATHSNLLAWRTPWTEEPGGLQFMGVAKSQTRLSDEKHSKGEPSAGPGESHEISQRKRQSEEFSVRLCEWPDGHAEE